MSCEEHWNSLNLISPPFLPYSVPRKSIDIEKLKSLLESAIKFYSSQEVFQDEVMLLSQIAHVGRNQLRMMKGFQEMKKLLQAAARLKRLDIVSILEIFNSYVTDDFQSEVSIPNRQNLDYLLIKLQGLAKVLIRIVTCTRKSARYFLGLIRSGSFYLKGSIYTSSLAKIWDEARQMCQYTVNLYNNLREFRSKFKVLDNLDWLSDSYELPDNLSDWLGDEYEIFVISPTNDSKLLTKPDDIENFRRNSQVSKKFEQFKAEDNQKKTFVLPDIAQMGISQQETKMDIDDMTVIPRKGIENVSNEYEHSLSSIKSKESINLFLKYEEKYRKQDVKKSITFKKVNNKVWKELKDDFKNKLALMQESSMIEYFHDNMNFYMEGQ